MPKTWYQQYVAYVYLVLVLCCLTENMEKGLMGFLVDYTTKGT